MKTLALLSVLLSPALSRAQPPLAGAVDQCAAGSTAACAAVSARLARLLAGESPVAPDRLMAEALAHEAVALVVERAGDIDGPRWARVLTALFRGDDARLEASADRELAHEVAARLMAAPLPECLSACGEGYAGDDSARRACDEACVAVFAPADALHARTSTPRRTVPTGRQRRPWSIPRRVAPTAQ